MNSLKSALLPLLSPRLVMHLQAADHYFNGEPELRLLKHLVNRGRTIIDAGANIGTYSYFLQRYGSVVHAYEPNPDLAARLTNLMPRVKVRQVALSDAVGDLTFSVPIDESGRAIHELGSVAQSFSGRVRHFSVKCVTIDAEAIENVGFIKIDVEQHERQVLRGAVNTIRDSRPVILVEVYPLKYERSIPEEFDFVLKNRYCGWFAFAGQWLPLSSLRSEVHAAPANFGQKNKFMGNNLLLVPQEHPIAQIGPKPMG